MTTSSAKTLNKVATHPVQTWEWGEFRKEWGNIVVRFDFGQITVHKLPIVPFCVGVFEKGPQIDSKMIETLKSYAKSHNIIFIKLEPNVAKSSSSEKILRNNGARRGKTIFTPSTFTIDLTKSENELLSSFHPKTRYNIRLSQRKGVTVVEDNSDQAFEIYWKLTEETTKRQGFYAHTKKYHTLMWKHMRKANIAHLLIAKYENEPLAAWVLFKWKDCIYYPYGASSDSHKNLMAPNLMMWEAILWGKKQKAKVFDLWGREEGAGFTKFKEGYSPQIVEFLGAWDLVCSPLYWVYIAADWARWKILRLRAKLK